MQIKHCHGSQHSNRWCLSVLQSCVLLPQIVLSEWDPFSHKNHVTFNFLKCDIYCSISDLFRVKPSSNSKAIITFVISFELLSKKVCPCFLINLHCFWDRMWKFDSVFVTCFPIPSFHFRDDYVSSSNSLKYPPLNAASSWIWLAAAYSASSIGLESLTWSKSIQSDDSLRHWQSIFHPLVVVFGIRFPCFVNVKPSIISTEVLFLVVSKFL